MQTVLIQVMVESYFKIEFILLMYFVLIVKCFIYNLFLEVILMQEFANIKSPPRLFLHSDSGFRISGNSTKYIKGILTGHRQSLGN